MSYSLILKNKLKYYDKKMNLQSLAYFKLSQFSEFILNLQKKKFCHLKKNLGFSNLCYYT